ncbi:MAG: hypothetical protein AAGA15_16165 [Pseudomonadota bacterium]
MTDELGRAAQAATTPDVLPPQGLRLLGTMGTKDAPEALLLLGQDVLRVRPGDRAGKSTILAIEPGRIMLKRGAASESLAVAG